MFVVGKCLCVVGKQSFVDGTCVAYNLPVCVSWYCYQLCNKMFVLVKCI